METLRRALGRERALRRQALAQEKEALEEQTATAEILRIISSSPTDIQPVFDAIVRSAARLCNARFIGMYRYDGGLIHFVASHGMEPEAVAALRRRYPQPPEDESLVTLSIRDRRVTQVLDFQAEPDAPRGSRAFAGQVGGRSQVVVPLLRDEVPIGAIALLRVEAGPFPERELALLRSFANQAVIAIENARLFNETKEALEQQTAISEILRVISDSPTDVKPVLETVAMRAAKICDASDARIWLVEGDAIRHAAGFGDVPITVETGDTRPIERGLLPGRAILDRAPVHVEDIQAVSSEDLSLSRHIARHSGWRTAVSVPLLRESRALGAITLRRMEVRPFTEKQISLLKTFADQAAIAIENARLFNETKEALEQQTATGDILRVIAGSPTNTQPVFDAVCTSAARLCDAYDALIWRVEGEHLLVAGHYGPIPTPDEPLPLSRGTSAGRAAIERRTIH
ncbi:MAG TPA: GAF domain-containing protein, partial [Burkholderiales bacterium]|nr:GAF domain-containing protein [Burkholderiales bacterium]